MQKKAVSLALLAGFIAGCGGGGGGSTTGIAYYVDSPVEGVTYTCGSQEGLTDAKGTFIFEKGKGCTFYLGDILLKSINSNILSNGITIQEKNLNTARLLQSLDWDGNASNGITIKPEIISGLKQKGFTSFPVSEDQFDQLGTKLQQLRNEKSGFRGALVSEEEAEAHLEGNHPPIITATANPTIIYEGESVHFDASGSSDPDHNHLSFLWKLGDTTLSQASSFTQTFNSRGNYTVTLTVTDSEGKSVSKSFTIRVDEGSRDHTPPVITLKGDDPLETDLNETVLDPGIEVADDQDDPSDITVATTGHINQDGTVMTNKIGRFLVYYFVSDTSGNEANITREIQVRYPENRQKYLEEKGDHITGVMIDREKNLVWANGSKGCKKLTIRKDQNDDYAKRLANDFCSNLAKNHYGGYDGWRVGTFEENSHFIVEAYGENIQLFYTHPGCIRVMGIESNGDVTLIKTRNTYDIGNLFPNTFSSASSEVVAGVRCVTDQFTPNQPPIAEAGSDISIEENATFTFDGSGSSDPDGSIVKYEWIYGGETINSDTSSATYTRDATQPAGDYNVTLKVTDDKGATDEDWVIVHVTPKQ